MLGAEFLLYLKNEKRCSVHTLTAYSKDIQVFELFLKERFNEELIAASSDNIRAYIVSLMEEGLDTSTVGRKLSTLRSLFKFAIRKGMLHVNPMHSIKAPKLTKKLPVFIEDNKLIDLLNMPATFPNTFAGMRDKLIIELLFGTGIRLSELLSIEKNDLDYYSKTIKVLGKRNKERIIPIPASVCEMINNFSKYRTLHNLDNQSSKLIVTNTGADAYTGLVYRAVKNYLSIISTQEKRSPHVLRHTYATTLLNNGADLNAIKELLGHASLAATQVYVHNSIERLKSVYKQAHPKA